MDLEASSQANWKTFLAGLTESLAIAGPVEEPALLAAEQRLGGEFPPALRAAIAQTGGFGIDAFGLRELWPLDEIVRVNEWLRNPTEVWSEDGPWIERLCFGDDVAGNFFYVGPGSSEVWVWNFIDGEGYLLAPSLATFYKGWIEGDLGT